jgi:hypothetical protein
VKRYRVLNFDLDSRADVLSREIQAAWEPHVREQHHRNQINVLAGLLTEFGTLSAETKIRNFIDLGNAPLSILAFHNKFLAQIRSAFVIGAYYPALTSTCALGERILNHLILRLKEFYKSSPEYKKVYNKKSFTDWDLAIDTLEAWSVLLPDVATTYRQLAQIRHQKAIHFNPETEENDREIALEAIKTLSEIISTQFSAFGPEPWFIPNIPGCSFIKREAEQSPFIQTVYLPNCVLVGPFHRLEVKYEEGRYLFHVVDDYPYEKRDITDEEFVEIIRTKSA